MPHGHPGCELPCAQAYTRDTRTHLIPESDKVGGWPILQPDAQLAAPGSLGPEQTINVYGYIGQDRRESLTPMHFSIFERHFRFHSPSFFSSTVFPPFAAFQVRPLWFTFKGPWLCGRSNETGQRLEFSGFRSAKPWARIHL